jgi:hypothetical protein
MLKVLKPLEVHFIALLAKAARDERDALLGNVPAGALDEPQPAHGEHNPTSALGFEPLPLDSPQLAALREELVRVGPAGRCELYALMRIGQGHLGARDWAKGIAETERLGDPTTAEMLTEDVDLREHLLKGLRAVTLAA